MVSNEAGKGKRETANGKGETAKGKVQTSGDGLLKTSPQGTVTIHMKVRIKIVGTGVLLSLLFKGTAMGQVGKPFIHDPSTITKCEGKYYTFGTGGGGLISSDGWTWNGGGVRPGGGAAPDVVKIGDRYLVAYGATGGGLAGGHNGRILTMWNKTLDPTSPDFKYSEAVVVRSEEHT